MLYTMENLKDIYRSLFNMNLEAATDEYLQHFEGEYSPEQALSDCQTSDDVQCALNRLVGEILDDTGDEDLTREWLENAGADAALIALCGM